MKIATAVLGAAIAAVVAGDAPAVAVAQQTEPPRGAQPPVPPTATSTRLTDLEDRPQEYVGRLLTVYGEVEDVLGSRVFRIDEPNWADFDRELLVVLEAPLTEALEQGDRVTVTGTMRPFAELEASRAWEGLPLDPELEAEIRRTPVLVAIQLVEHER